MAGDKTPLIEFLKVEQGWEKDAVASFSQASKDIDAEIMKLKPKSNVSSRLRLEQLNASKKAINEKLSDLYTELGDSITAAQYKAVAAAVPVSNSEAIAFINKHGANSSLLVDSLTEKAQNRLKAAMTRVQGKSYVPLSKSVYKNEALTKGVVDGIVNSGIANGLSAREIADRVKAHIDPSVPGGASYAAMRLGRTEINNAYHATQIEEHINSPWVGEIEWNTSGSHKNEDECDEYAEMSPWPKDKVPRKPHPQCFCFITPVAMAEDDFLDTLFAEKEGKTVDSAMFAGNEALERWLQETKEIIKPPKQIQPSFNSYTVAMDWLKSQATYDGLSSKGKLSSMLAAHQKGNTSSVLKHAKDAKGDVKQAFENITGAKLAGPPASDLPKPVATPATKSNAALAKPSASDLDNFEDAIGWIKKQPQFVNLGYNAKADLASALISHKKGYLATAWGHVKDLPDSAKKAFEDITGAKAVAPGAKKHASPIKKTTAKKTTAKKTTTTPPADADTFAKMKAWAMDEPSLNFLSSKEKSSLSSALLAHKKGNMTDLPMHAKLMGPTATKKFEDITGYKIPEKVKAPTPPPPAPPKPTLTPAQKKWEGKPAPVKPTKDPELKLPALGEVKKPPGFNDKIIDAMDSSHPMFEQAELLIDATANTLQSATGFIEYMKTMGVLPGVKATALLDEIDDILKSAKKGTDSKLIAAIKAQDDALDAWEKDFADWKAANAGGSGKFGMDATTRWRNDGDGVKWANDNLPVAAEYSVPYNAMKKYSGSSYQEWNAALRAMDDRHGTPKSAEWSKVTRDADKAMKPLPNSVIVHRGSNVDAFVLDGERLGFDANASDMQSLAGTVQVDYAYTSTSVGAKSAFTNKSVQLKIRVPEGHGAAWIRPYSKYPEENELVLQRGTRLFFHDVYQETNGGRWIVEAEVIPEDMTVEEFVAMGRRPSTERFKVNDYERS